jgi:predicted dehydrogenase
MITTMTHALTSHLIRAGMVGAGMIFNETYRPFFLGVTRSELYHPATGPVRVELVGIASLTGSRVEHYRNLAPAPLNQIVSYTGIDAAQQLASSNVHAVCIATPDDRHFSAALAALSAGKHVLIEKPSVLSLTELDELQAAARRTGVLAKVVYHKLLDPDHKKLRTYVADGTLQHVNNGYCSLLEPKSIATGQFAEWLTGRNPGTYVAVHYLKLIDFTFGPNWKLNRISATGQRGIVAPPTSPTWDSVLLQVVYTYPDGREAAFDIHTSWVTPDNFPGYVDQEVQFRFDNGIWIAHQRKRGVELAVEGRTPHELKNTPNHHYNGAFLEPWGERSQRGYGIEVIERFFHEVAYVEYGGPPSERAKRLRQMQDLTYNDLSADRNCVAIVQALEAILRAQADGHPGAVVKVNEPQGGLVIYRPGVASPDVLYAANV